MSSEGCCSLFLGHGFAQLLPSLQVGQRFEPRERFKTS